METVRAYSTLAVKSFSEEASGFTFAGLATSPVADRGNDRIDPLGAKYRNPVCLLRAHDHLTPIGECNFGRPTKSGITFEASIPKISEPGLLRDRLQMAAGEVRSGLMRGVSIGFRPTKSPEPNELGGFDYPATEIFELSTCAVPMHQLATIDQIKAIDAAILRGEAPAVTELPASLEMAAGIAKMLNQGASLPEVQQFKSMLYDRGLEIVEEVKAESGGKEMMSIIAMQTTAAFANALASYFGGRLSEIERRLSEPTLAYAGVHQRALGYRRGQAVTHKGCLYIALSAAEPGDMPGESAAWQMAVRAGRDGKDAR